MHTNIIFSFVPFLIRQPADSIESLILAQDERWRRGEGMQVERLSNMSRGERVSNT